MRLELLEVSPVSLAYTVIGGFAVFFSMVSLLVKERLYINEVVLGTVFGILMGPHCANIFDPRSWLNDSNILTLEITRVVLGTGLFAIGVELPGSYMRDHARGLLALVVPTMTIGWVSVAAFMHLLFPTLDYVSCLLITACLTPTDPVVSAAIVGGAWAEKHVPKNLRLILAAESAANDGLAYPFLSLAIYLTVDATTRQAIGDWFLVGWLYQVVLGTVIGAILGAVFSFLMKRAHKKHLIDQQSYVAQYLALALLTIGIVSTLGSDDLLGAFAAGSAISWDMYFTEQVEGESFAAVTDLVLNCACFVYIGAWMPFDAWAASLGVPLSFESGVQVELWRLALLAIIILVIRRIPALLLLYRFVPEVEGLKQAFFAGHFGPMGVGAIYISSYAVKRLPLPQSPPTSQVDILASSVQPIVAFVVLVSIFTHGLSIPFFSVGRRMHSRTLSVASMGTPDWLMWARRTNTVSTANVVDIENASIRPKPGMQSEPVADVGRAEVMVSITPEGRIVTDKEVKVEGPQSVAHRRIFDAEASNSPAISRQSSRQESRKGIVSTPGSPSPASPVGTRPGTPASTKERETDPETPSRHVRFPIHEEQ